jgi:hypothetical protein
MMTNMSSDSEDEEQGYDDEQYAGQSSGSLETQELVSRPWTQSHATTPSSQMGLSMSLLDVRMLAAQSKA